MGVGASPGGLHSVALENYEKTREPIRLDVVNTFSVSLLLLLSQNFSCCYKAIVHIHSELKLGIVQSYLVEFLVQVQTENLPYDLG